LKKKGCTVRLCETPEAAGRWNRAEGKIIGLLHVTCEKDPARAEVSTISESIGARLEL